MLSQEHVEQYLREMGYLDLFYRCANQGVASWPDVVAGSPENMGGANPLEKANYVNRRISELITEGLENDKNASINSEHQSKNVTFQNGFSEITVRFKKLNRKRRTMNSKTRRVRELWYENMKTLPGPFTDWINVTFGWMLTTTGTIRELAVVCEFGDKLAWYFLVNETGTQLVPAPVQLHLDIEPSQTEPYIAKVRNTERAQRIAKSDADKEVEDAN